MAKQTAADFVPDTHDLDELSDAAQSCKGCDLYLNATQTVFGDGSRKADIMLVGEQPGDQEDKAGAPFVGPAGRLLDKALDAAGIDRKRAYVTNAVKHFKFTLPERGKRRIRRHRHSSEEPCNVVRPCDRAGRDSRILLRVKRESKGKDRRYDLGHCLHDEDIHTERRRGFAAQK